MRQLLLQINNHTKTATTTSAATAVAAHIMYTIETFPSCASFLHALVGGVRAVLLLFIQVGQYAAL